MKNTKLLLLITLLITLCGCELFGKSIPKVTIDYNCNGIEKHQCPINDSKLNCIIIVPECSGYSFIGWYDNKTGVNEINLDSDFKEGTTIYALWEEDGSPKKVSETVKDSSSQVVKSKPSTPIIKKYTISFNINGGIGYFPELKVKKDELMPNIDGNIPVRNDYIFMGWYDNKDYTLGKKYYNESNESSSYYDKNKNITLYAGWKKIIVEEIQPVKQDEKYLITFNANGGKGNLPSNITLKGDEKIPQIDKLIPTRNGYKFTGWYDNKDYTKGIQYYDADCSIIKLYSISKDLNLYAGWSKEIVILSYKILFDANGGQGGQVNSIAVKNGENLPVISDASPQKNGYEFTGWYDSVNEGTMYYDKNGNPQIKFTEENNVTLYAHYKAKNYTISFDINGGKGNIPSDVKATYEIKVPKIDNNRPSKEGYTFLGWYDNKNYVIGTSYYDSKNNGVLNYNKDEDLTLYAGWSKKEEPIFILTFNANGGTGGQSLSVNVKKNSPMPSIITTPPEKTGYTFLGWYDEVSGGNKYYDSLGEGIKKYDKESGTTLYAQYSPITYKISYNLNGGSINNVTSTTYDKVTTINNPKKTFTIKIDANKSNANISKISTSEVQEFIGWTASDNLDTSNAKYGKTTDVINRWTSNNYKVNDTYFKNLINSNETITLTANWKPKNITLPTIAKKGYICGYSTTNTGNILYESSESYTPSLTSNEVTLYAKCNPIKYIITFNKNGGTGGQSTEVNAINGDAMPQISKTSPTRSGYTFMGWYDNADYTKGKQYYTASGNSARNYDKENGITLYAGWKKLSYSNVNYKNFKWNAYYNKTGPAKKYYSNVTAYGIWAPENVSDLNGVSLPLLIWLHGSGQLSYVEGMTIYKYMNVSFPKVVANWNKGELQPIPAIIVAPQSDGRWATEDPSYTRNVNSIKAIIESAKEIYNIDTSKIVITGYSLGGRGVTSVAYEMQKRFSKDYFSKLLVMSSGSGAIYPSKDSKEGKAYFKSKDIKGFAEPGTNTKDFFDWIGKPEKYRELKNATHGTIAEKVFTLDENKNKISDMVEWMFLD